MENWNSPWEFYWIVLKKSVQRFFHEDAMTYSAALAFFMVFSLPPILVIVIRTAGVFSLDAEVRGAVLTEMADLVGADGTEQIGATLDRLNEKKPTGWASAVAVGVVLFSATAVVTAGKRALNRLFSVTPPSWKSARGLWIQLRDRVISFAMLIVMGFMVAASMSLDAVLTLFGNHLRAHFGSMGSWIAVMDTIVLRILVLTFLFAMLFRYLSDLRLRWRDTVLGALLTAGLFAAGGHLVGSLIGRSKAASYYDAAGDLLVLMLWAYYAAALLLLGATFSFVRADLLSKNRGAS